MQLFNIYLSMVEGMVISSRESVRLSRPFVPKESTKSNFPKNVINVMK